eukprot:TRINITY_DN10758_c0_g1_i1.p1 TRINITY_DN10758_c0_g1~~TRINITY_DN10758_c0_g1_i1.p1  ORF type:complete len:127 (-),score=29.04 TRINITY_DN10758_c0_g1_i1:247-627(-)
MKPTHMRKTKKKKQNRGKATGVGLSVFFFIAGYQGGIGTLFFVFINELLPAEVKDIGFIYASTLQWTLSVLMATLYPMMTHSALNVNGSFFLFSGFSIFSTIYLAVAIPQPHKEIQVLESRDNPQK